MLEMAGKELASAVTKCQSSKLRTETICIYIYATAYLQYSVRQVRLLYLAQFHVASGSGYAIQKI